MTSKSGHPLHFPSTSLYTLLFTSIISPSNTCSVTIGNVTIFVDMHHNVMSYLVILQIWRRTWSSTVEEKPNRCRESKKLFCVLDIWKLIYSFTVRRSLILVASAKSHTERLRVWKSIYTPSQWRESIQLHRMQKGILTDWKHQYSFAHSYWREVAPMWTVWQIIHSSWNSE